MVEKEKLIILSLKDWITKKSNKKVWNTMDLCLLKFRLNQQASRPSPPGSLPPARIASNPATWTQDIQPVMQDFQQLGPTSYSLLPSSIPLCCHFMDPWGSYYLLTNPWDHGSYFLVNSSLILYMFNYTLFEYYKNSSQYLEWQPILSNSCHKELLSSLKFELVQ